MMSGGNPIVKPFKTSNTPLSSNPLLSNPTINITPSTSQPLPSSASTSTNPTNAIQSRISTRTTRLTGALRRGFISALALSPQGKNSAVGDLVGNLAPERYGSLPARTRAAAKALIIVALSRSLTDAHALAARTPASEMEYDETSAWFDAVAAALAPTFEFPIDLLHHLHLSDNKDESNPRIAQLPLEPVSLDCVYGVDCVDSVLAKPSNNINSTQNQKNTFQPKLELIFQQSNGNPMLRLGFDCGESIQDNDVNVMDVDEMEPIFVRNVKQSSFINNEDPILSTGSSEREPNFSFRQPFVTPLDQLMEELSNGKQTKRVQKGNLPVENPDVIILDSSSKQKTPSTLTKPLEPTSATLRERKRLRKRRSRTSEIETGKADATQRELLVQKERIRNTVISTMQETPKPKRVSTNIPDPRRSSIGKTPGSRDRPARRAAAPSKIIESDSDSTPNNDGDNDPDAEVELGIIDVPVRNSVQKKVNTKPSSSTPTPARTRNATNVSQGVNTTKNDSITKVVIPTTNEGNRIAGRMTMRGTGVKTKANVTPTKAGNQGHGTGKLGSHSAAKNTARPLARTTRSKTKTKDVGNEVTENKLQKSISLDDIDAAADAAAEDRSEPEIMEEEEIIEEHDYDAGDSEILPPATPSKSNEKTHMKKTMRAEEQEPWHRGLHEIEKKLDMSDNDSLSLSSSDSDDPRPKNQVLPTLAKLLAYAKKKKINPLELDKVDEDDYIQEYYGTNEEFPRYKEGGPSPGTQYAIHVYEQHRNGGQQLAQNVTVPVAEEVDGLLTNHLTAQAIDEATMDLNLDDSPAISVSRDSSDATSNEGSSGEEHDGASGDDARTEKGSSRKKPTKPADLRLRVCAGLLEEMTADAKRKVLRWAKKDHSWFDENQDFAEVVAKRDIKSCNRCQTLNGKQAQCEESILIKLWRDMSWRRVRRMRHKRPGGRGRAARD